MPVCFWLNMLVGSVGLHPFPFLNWRFMAHRQGLFLTAASLKDALRIFLYFWKGIHGKRVARIGWRTPPGKSWKRAPEEGLCFSSGEGGWYPPIPVIPPGWVAWALSPKQAENRIGWELQSSKSSVVLNSYGEPSQECELKTQSSGQWWTSRD